MESEECLCFICSECVCDKELLNSMNLNDVRDLSKSFSQLISTEITFEVTSAPLCLKCINRVLDAHNLLSQINLLNVKLRAIQYDVCSLVRKTEEAAATTATGESRSRSRKNATRTLSKFAQLRKDILAASLSTGSKSEVVSKTQRQNSLTNTTIQWSPAAETTLKTEVEIDPLYITPDVLDQDGMAEEFDTSDNTKALVNISTKAEETTNRRTHVPARMSSRLKTKSRRFSDYVARSDIPTDSSEDDSTNDADNDEHRNSDTGGEKSPQRKGRTSTPKTKPSLPNYEPDEDPLKTKLTCPHERCNTVYFASEFSLNAHIKRIHEGIKKPFSCDICGRAFQYPTYLRAHQLSHIGQDNFPCSHCGKIMKSEKSRRVHEKIHREGGKPFKCEQCDKSFANKQHLQSHELSHETNMTYACEECGKTFSRQRSLELHKRGHRQPDQNRCSTCNKTFSTETSRKIHEELHELRKKPRICTQCPFECALRRDMKRHVKSHHSPSTTFTCEHCGRQLATEKTLISHLRLHTKERPFSCEICKKAFKDENARKRHELLHFKNTFICEFCGKAFAANCYLSQHLKLHTKKPRAQKSKGGVDELVKDDKDETKETNEEGEIFQPERILGVEIVAEEDEVKDEINIEDVDASAVVMQEFGKTYTFAEVVNPDGEIQFVEVVEMNE